MHSNVAGRTDLTSPPEFLIQIRDRLDKQITQTIDDANNSTNSTSDGSTVIEGHELKNDTTSNETEGLIITEITTGI